MKFFIFFFLFLFVSPFVFGVSQDDFCETLNISLISECNDYWFFFSSRLVNISNVTTVNNISIIYNQTVDFDDLVDDICDELEDREVFVSEDFVEDYVKEELKELDDFSSDPEKYEIDKEFEDREREREHAFRMAQLNASFGVSGSKLSDSDCDANCKLKRSIEAQIEREQLIMEACMFNPDLPVCSDKSVLDPDDESVDDKPGWVDELKQTMISQNNNNGGGSDFDVKWLVIGGLVLLGGYAVYGFVKEQTQKSNKPVSFSDPAGVEALKKEVQMLSAQNKALSARTSANGTYANK